MHLLSSMNTDKGRKTKTLQLSSKQYFTIFSKYFVSMQNSRYFYLLDEVILLSLQIVTSDPSCFHTSNLPVKETQHGKRKTHTGKG